MESIAWLVGLAVLIWVWITPAVMLWTRRHRIPLPWAFAAAVTLATMPFVGVFVAWYVVLRDWPSDTLSPPA